MKIDQKYCDLQVSWVDGYIYLPPVIYQRYGSACKISSSGYNARHTDWMLGVSAWGRTIFVATKFKTLGRIFETRERLGGTDAQLINSRGSALDLM